MSTDSPDILHFAKLCESYITATDNYCAALNDSWQKQTNYGINSKEDVAAGKLMMDAFRECVRLETLLRKEIRLVTNHYQ